MITMSSINKSSS